MMTSVPTGPEVGERVLIRGTTLKATPLDRPPAVLTVRAGVPLVPPGTLTTILPLLQET